jgi:hypothetical protein
MEVVASGCPKTIPVVGTACVPSAFPCVYGPEAILELRAHFWCDDASRKWRGPERGEPEKILAQHCPATRADALGTACSEPGKMCAYGEQFCGCAAVSCVAGCTSPGTWQCPDPHGKDARCPIKTPDTGSRCDVEGTLCWYFGCGFGPILHCESGEWRPASPICEG